MLRNTADSEADVERFILRVTATEVVWYLDSEEGLAVSESNELEDDDGPLTVLMFFSDRAYAKRALLKSFPGFQVQSMSLFDFLYRWLPGMSADHRLAGPNWTGDLIGLEVDQLNLRERIEANMSPERRTAHDAEFKRLTGQ